jgi:hypothetical protein
MRRGASLGQRGWHGYGLQLNADAHEDARAQPAFDFFRSTVPTDRETAGGTGAVRGRSVVLNCRDTEVPDAL